MTRCGGGCMSALSAPLTSRRGIGPRPDGRQDGARAMLGVIMLGRQLGHDRPRAAVARAVAHGACDLGAVRYRLAAGEPRRASPAVIEVGSLARD